MQIRHQKERDVLDIFKEISRFPRCAKNEAGVRAWLIEWAGEHGFRTETDPAGNLRIDVPGSGGSGADPVIFQNHMDMVCEKAPDSDHDFDKDPISWRFENQWLHAEGTTLGADNGVGLAIAMALAADKNLDRPPLELLCTVEEEIGLVGAMKLQPGFLKGRRLINLDSEEEGVFTVGCAGGRNTTVHLSLEFADAPAGFKPFTLKAGGMTGGHSGIDIHKQRANAIQALGRVLHVLADRHGAKAAGIAGGAAFNAIPRDAQACGFAPAGAFDDMVQTVESMEAALKDEFSRTDPELTLRLEASSTPENNQVMTAASARKATDLVLTLPHGVCALVNEGETSVETSNNLGKVFTEDGRLTAVLCQRSSKASRLDMITGRVEAAARLAGAAYDSSEGAYPPWEPDPESDLLLKSAEAYEVLFNKTPGTQVIHAGLECGVIRSIYPDMDVISLGPTIENAHSPSEQVDVDAIGRVYDFLAALLKRLK